MQRKNLTDDFLCFFMFPTRFYLFVTFPGANKLDCETEKRLDVTGYEAIKALHKSMDDDLSGTVDLSESIEVGLYIYLQVSNQITDYYIYLIMFKVCT